MAVQLPPQDVRAGGGGGRSAEGRGRESPHNLACKEEGPLLWTRSLYCSQTGCTGRRCPPLPSRPPGRRRDSWAPSSCRIQMTSPFLPGLGIDISWHSPRKLLAVSPPARRPPTTWEEAIPRPGAGCPALSRLQTADGVRLPAHTVPGGEDTGSLIKVPAQMRLLNSPGNPLPQVQTTPVVFGGRGWGEDNKRANRHLHSRAPSLSSGSKELLEDAT